MDKILVINGPNLGLLGKRQTHLYGTQSLAEILQTLNKHLPHSCEISAFQSNSEGDILDFLNQAYLAHFDNKIQIMGIIINPGALTHTSVALRDALEVFLEFKTQVYEVHLSNIFKREEFRHTSYISGVAHGVICGLGAYGYEAALHKILKNGSPGQAGG